VLSRWRSLSRRTAVLVTTTLAAVTALAGLGYQPLSWDEAVTLSAARHPPGRLLALLTHADAPLGGYYLLMHGWVWLAGTIGIVPAEGWLRLPSGLAAVATVALVTKLAPGWFGPQAGLLAGALLAVHPNRAKAQALRRGYRLIWTRAFGEVTVTLFARSPAAG